MAFAELLGNNLLGEGLTKLSTTEALSGKKAVGLYFSAHWCPPCKAFTPQLASWYKEALKDKGLEIIFVSGDRDDESFKSYFAEMPWLAVDFSEKEITANLNKKFKVKGIPSFVILDSSGNLITSEGRAAVTKDPKGEEFPWIPPKTKDLLEKMKLVGPSGASSLKEAMAGKKALALYFSAHWCPPCRGFTPQLSQWYEKDLKAKGLEVVFVSSDRTEEDFKGYFGEMPWLALDYSDRKLKEQISTVCKVQGIPSLVVFDADLNLVTLNGRNAVTADPVGAELPWHPKPVNDLEGGPGDIEEVPTVLAFCETCSDDEKKAVEEALTGIAKTFVDKQKAAEEDQPEIAFMTAKKQSALGGRIRGMLGLPSLPPAPHQHELKKQDGCGPGWGCDGCGQDGNGKERYRCAEGCDYDFCGECYNLAYSGKEAPKHPVQLALLDIPSDGAYYLGEAGTVTAESVRAFVDAYKAGKLERKQLG